MIRTLTLTALAGLLAACASTGPNTHRSDIDRLQSECDARGGILTPSGASTGQATLDNACRIKDAVPPRN
jgi:hypothetical protein